MEIASSAGMLATDGGLLFTGKLTGEFIALDQDNGKTLWQFKTGSWINAPPITYTHKGRQYVTVLSGRGGSVPNRFAGEIGPGRRLGVDVRADARMTVMGFCACLALALHERRGAAVLAGADQAGRGALRGPLRDLPRAAHAQPAVGDRSAHIFRATAARVLSIR